MSREKHFHPLAALHLLRKTLLVYLLPLVQVLFDRNWDALRAALRQELVLLFFISAVCWAVYYGGRWQVDAEGTVHVSWRLGVRLDRALRAEGLAALVLEQPLVYRLAGACRVVLSAAPVPSAPAVRVPPGHLLYRVAISLGGDGAARQPDPCIPRQRKGHGAQRAAGGS